MTNEERIKLDIISAYIGSPLTEEQKEFASNFTKDTISFSDPGTGKTHTLVSGLIMAQQYHKVPGKEINCMSFTNAAVSEMAGRYEALCKKCGVSPTVVFNTFHSLSNRIMREAYPTMRILRSNNLKGDIADLTVYLEEVGIDVGDDTRYVRKILRAMNSLNSSLTFHPDNVRRKYAFVELGIDLETFQQLRKKWFVRGLTMKEIVQGDIPLYCLYALMKQKDIIEKWKGKYKIMVVDEFQDLSLLHLQILSYIAETLIVIGDMKQQIYAFNGACPQIVKEYSKLHPNARVCNLTKSFRCSTKIAEFATELIRPNDNDIECFSGHTRCEEDVQLVRRKDLDWAKIVADIETDQRIHGRAAARDVMFLYRNNASAIPIIEELYKKGISFRCSNFAKIMDIPIFDSLSKLANLAWQPNDYVIATEALRLFPEFKDTMFGTEPAPVQAMRASGKDFLSINYRFQQQSSVDICLAIQAARNAIADNKSAGVVYMKLIEVYRKYIFKNEWWKIDNNEEFYFNLVAPIANNKPYPLMYNEELDKESHNIKCIKAGMGIRCYTMHSAKGLEADDVYILDCDEGVFPNQKIMNNKIKAGCLYDVATDIRSERNLLYVAITRAKDTVTISYSGAAPSKLVSSPNNNEYCKYDPIYANEDNDYDDAAEFFKLYNIGG